jgi:hypothetical protein
MSVYQYIVTDQTTNQYSIVNKKTLEVLEKEIINPIEHELLPQDSFIWDDKKLIIVHSVLKYMQNIACVLLCQERQVTKRCYLYKCIPNNKQFPIFWAVSTTHYTSNQYVVLQFKQWFQQQILADLSLVLGNDFKAYWEYSLYCLQMNPSFDKITNEFKRTKKITTMQQTIYQIKTYTNTTAFTIHSSEHAFDIEKMENNEIKLSIYVANVGLLLDYYKLWMFLPTPYTSVQLPNRQQSMLSEYFESKCELSKYKNNHVFCISILLDTNYVIKSIFHENAYISIHDNYHHDQQTLLENEQYQLLLQTTHYMSQKYKYLEKVETSQDVITYLTHFVQYQTAQEFLRTKEGILCNAVIQKQIQLKQMSLPKDIVQPICCWLSQNAEFTSVHSELQMPTYAYLLSPFQRIVDVINIMGLQKQRWKNIFSKEANEFYNQSIQDIPKIHWMMDKAKQIENESKLLHLYELNNEIFNNLTYDGYICKKIKRDNNHGFQYYIYLPVLEVTMSLLSMDDLDEYSKQQFKINVQKDNMFENKIQIELDIDYSSLLDKYVFV